MYFFISDLESPEDVLDILLKQRTLPGHITAVYIHNIIKILSNLFDKYAESGDKAAMIKVLKKQFFSYFFLIK